MTYTTVWPRLRTVLICGLLWFAAWLPRVIGLQRFVTADEDQWLIFTANFYQALGRGEFARTFQVEHPGVTVLWAGLLGFVQKFPSYAQLAPGQFAYNRDELSVWLQQNSSHTPLTLLVAGRWWVVLIIALCLVLAYFPLRRLWGSGAAFLAVLFGAWDPFHIALSRQLQPDGLLAVFTYLALLYFLVWLYQSQQRRHLFLSGVMMGLAWLTKTPAIFLVPTGALLIALDLWHLRTPQARFRIPASVWRTRGMGYVLWGGVAIATFVLFWPAMWVDPLGTLGRMSAKMSLYAEGHIYINYFWGRPTEDPGLLFYPVAYLFRSTPATLIGLLAAICAFAWRRWPLDQPAQRRSALALLLFALIIAAGMTNGAKKFDRYLLPVFLPLDLVAILGWLALVSLLLQSRFRPMPLVSLSPYLPVTLPVILLLHGLLGFRQYPYYFDYFNPLLGGDRTAPQMLFIGWGEGLEEAAAWLNQQPNADQLRIAAWYATGPLSYYLRSHAEIQSFWRPNFWFDTDYAVLYVNQWQRQIPSVEVSDWFVNRQPVHTVYANGLELVRIYDMREVTPPEFSGLFIENAVDIADTVRFAAYAMGTHAFLAGDSFAIRLYWKSLIALDAEYVASVRLLNPAGVEVARNDLPIKSKSHTDWPLHTILATEHTLLIPADASPGLYNLVMSVAKANASDDPLGGKLYPITAIQVSVAKAFALNVDWGEVQLSAIQHEAQIHPGQSSLFQLTAGGQLGGGRKLSLRLVDAGGTVRVQADKEVTAQMRFDLQLPGDAPAGAYSVVAVLYDATTLNPFPDKTENFAPTVSHIAVTAR
jgi:hypothetical protein